MVRWVDIAVRLLDVANVQADDVIYDLECGDGTLVVIAARRYGSRSVCMDMRSTRLRVADATAKAKHVENLIAFKQQSWSETRHIDNVWRLYGPSAASASTAYLPAAGTMPPPPN